MSADIARGDASVAVTTLCVRTVFRQYTFQSYFHQAPLCVYNSTEPLSRHEGLQTSVFEQPAHFDTRGLGGVFEIIAAVLHILLLQAEVPVLHPGYSYFPSQYHNIQQPKL